ncbi:DoxX family protein [Fimbriiglobus ruber]|uniref:Uncharacterized protein n=1 Tax=Fimbriiglobus ruber TaxID=1908690 RepID=A0A225DCG7_9BACT|nr:DoxX family protein [Fimbriiglobus ruber]OWK36228.1 hypothetical protein FRUB_08791 [Fimbriiglobus ruber]
MTPPVPLSVLYAGLAGTVLALVVATAQNKWQPRVFFLLALRLAIGWHFLFEGLHKIHSYYIGPSETNRVFTSEPYFAAAEGPFGDYMRKKYLGDPEAAITSYIAPKESIAPAEFAKLSPDEQAAKCPAPVASAIQAAADETLPTVTEEAQKAQADADARKAEATQPPPTGKTKADLEKASFAAALKATVAKTRVENRSNGGRVLKIAYAKWVYGVDRRDAKIKFISGDVPLSVPERLELISLLKKEKAELAPREAADLGNGNGIEMTRAKGVRTDLRTAQTDLVSDADKFVALLKSEAGAPDAEPKKSPLAANDWLTMWMITIVGACLLAGLFTPAACVVGAGFLALTYLTHPPFPWFPLPPNTEGNPLFINKNVIEAIAMLAIAVHPTGRWMGLDALWTRLFPFGRREPV